MFNFLIPDLAAEPAVNLGAPVVGPAAAAMPHPAVRARGGRGRGRGRRGRGLYLDARARNARMSAARARRRAAATEESLHTLKNLVAPAERQRISDEFSFLGGKKKLAVETAPLLFDESHKFVFETRRQHSRRRLRALVSYQRRVQEKLPDFVAGSEVLVVSEVCDDATLWTRTPADNAQMNSLLDKRRVRFKAAAASGKKPPRELLARPDAQGRNKATTCMSIVQHLIVSRDRGRERDCVQLHVPMIPMPKTNWATLASRKRKWSLVTGSSAGIRWRARSSPDVLQGRVDDIPVILKLGTHDSAATMHCLSASEEREAAAAWEQHGKIRLTYWNPCVGHQACLCTRPAYKACGDLSTTVVRLGHVLSGSTQMQRFLACLDDEVAAQFSRKPCIELSAEAAEWRKRSQWLIAASLPGKDMTDADVEALLDFFNGPWKPGGPLLRYCLPFGRCAAGCTSDEESLEIAKSRARSALSGGLTVGLEYRWKGMDMAGAWCQRGRGLCDVLLGALVRMTSVKSLREAQAILDQGGALADLPHALQTTVKSSSVVQALQRDPGNRLLIRMSMVTSPQQRFLNQVMEVDRAMVSLAAASALDANSAECRSLRDACRRLNLRFLRGTNGAQAVATYMQRLLNLGGDDWHVLDGQEAEKLHCAVVQVRCMADVWRRLEFPFKRGRHELVSDLLPDEAHNEFRPDLAKTVLSDLQRRQVQCDSCLDYFMEGMQRLLTSQPRLAWQTADHVAVWIRIAGAVVERHHLKGQELYATRQRGLAPAAARVSQVSFQRSVVDEAHGISTRAHSMVLKERGLTRAVFSKLARPFRLGFHGSRGQAPGRSGSALTKRARALQRKLKAKAMPQRQRQKSCGYRSYRSRHWTVSARVGSPEFLAEERRLAAAWEALPPHEQGVWDADAASKNLARQQELAMPLTRDRVNALAGGVLFRHEHRGLLQQLFVDTCEQLRTHPAWQRGFGLMSPTTALRTEEVPSGITEEHARREGHELFAFDAEVVPNPRGTMKRRLTCAELHGGLCSTHPHLSAVKVLVYNLWALFKSWHISRESYPALLTIKGPTSFTAALLCDFLGKGVSANLVLLRRVGNCFFLDEVAGHGHFARRPICCTGEAFLEAYVSESWSSQVP